MSQEQNPYAPPAAQLIDSANKASDDEVRQAHLSYEGHVKSIATLYFLNFLIWGFVAFSMTMPFLNGPSQGTAPVSMMPIIILALLSLLFLAIGIGIYRLQQWARITAIVFAFPGLLFIPIGTIINGFILYLLFSTKGAYLFTGEYKRVKAETPHIKYKTSIYAWIALGLIILFVLGLALMSYVAD